MTNSRSVKQISSRHIGKGPDGGVFVARGVYSERLESAGGVEVARGVVVERIESDGGVVDGIVNERAGPQTGVAGLRRSNPGQR